MQAAYSLGRDRWVESRFTAANPRYAYIHDERSTEPLLATPISRVQAMANEYLELYQSVVSHGAISK